MTLSGALDEAATMTACSSAPTLVLDSTAVGSYVLGRRTPLGGYCYYRTPQWGVEEPNAPDTLAALECLRILAIDPPEPDATARWLRGLQRQDGGYATLTIGWGALRALDILGIEPGRSPRAWLGRQLEQVCRWRGPREWRGAVADALHTVELLRLAGWGRTSDVRDEVAQVLEAARDERGGWARPGADLETTALAMRLGAHAGLAPAGEEAVAEFLRGCEHRVLGLRLSPGAGTTSAGALWGGLELARTLSIRLHYPRAIADSVALLQRSDGGLGARHRAISTLRDTWLGLQAACLLADLQEERS